MTPEEERKLGVDLFNKTWTLMKKSDRTREDDDELAHCAHASAYHWQQVGSQAHRARSEWQCSRVYTVLGLAGPALRHARRCLELVESAPDQMEDWDLAFAYEALARAHAVAGGAEESARCLARARELGELLADPEDRELLDKDLATI